MKVKYFDNGESGHCCWDCTRAIEDGDIREHETPKGYFSLADRDTDMSDVPLWCCPFCGGDFKNNGRIESPSINLSKSGTLLQQIRSNLGTHKHLGDNKECLK